MRSPILFLENAIAGSAFLIAPERAPDLRLPENSGRFSLSLTDDKKFAIRVNTHTHEAMLPIAALEYMWCCAYLSYVLYGEYVEAQRVNQPALDLSENDRVCAALDAFNWARSNMLTTGKERWPADLPQPLADPAYGDDCHVANELFLCSVAWIIHHEIAHVVLRHGGHDNIYTVQQEREADLRATDWVISSSHIDLETQKRSLGVVCAILAMQFLDEPMGENSYVRSHPASVERLNYCLDRLGAADDSLAVAYASVSLQFQLSQLGITADLNGDSSRDILSNFMVAFATHGRQVSEECANGLGTSTTEST